MFRTAELYDPERRTWSAAASMPDSKAHHAAALLADGRVLVAGWFGDGFVWSPATEAWTTTGPMVRPGLGERTATLLPDGRVLVTGGEFRQCDEQQESCWFVPVKSVELFAP